MYPPSPLDAHLPGSYIVQRLPVELQLETRMVGGTDELKKSSVTNSEIARKNGISLDTFVHTFIHLYTPLYTLKVEKFACTNFRDRNFREN